MNAQAGGESPAAAAAGTSTPGELLRRERERRSLSVQQAAEDLHLGVSVIEAMESNRFQALGAPVYARGHLRKYALLLGLSPEFVIQRYEALSDTPAVPTPIPATVITPAPRERRPLKVPLWIVFVLLALLVAWGVFELLPEIRGLLSDASSDAPAAVAQNLAIAPAATSATTAPVESAASSSAVAVATTATGVATTGTSPATPATQAVTGPQVRLRLEFSEPSWTEIYDAAGNRLMFDMGVPNQPRTITGVAPLRVRLGFASAVTARVDDQSIVIPRRAGKDAARFTIAADGQVANE